MNEDGDTRGSRRYIALDIHKKYCVIGGVDREGRVVLHAVRVEHEDLEGWLKKNPRSTDHVVFESTTNAWHVYDLLEPLVERVVVANPGKVKQIATARVKTDVRDTFILARLLAANLVPEVWVPPVHVRELRQLLELVWYVLTRRQPYRHFSQERIAYKYLTWAWQMDEAARDGLTRQQFTRYYLMRLGIGQDLTRIALDPKHPCKISSEAQLLALRPELNHIE